MRMQERPRRNRTHLIWIRNRAQFSLFTCSRKGQTYRHSPAAVAVPAVAACHQLIVEILPVLAGEIRGTNQPAITP
jgi:hypothetical protein